MDDILCLLKTKRTKECTCFQIFREITERNIAWQGWAIVEQRRAQMWGHDFGSFLIQWNDWKLVYLQKLISVDCSVSGSSCITVTDMTWWNPPLSDLPPRKYWLFSLLLYLEALWIQLTVFCHLFDFLVISSFRPDVWRKNVMVQYTILRAAKQHSKWSLLGLQDMCAFVL